MGEGCSFTGGGAEFFSPSQRGGPDFFPVGKGGDQNFLRMERGGPENIGDRPSQTDTHLPVKNDSSLN